MKIDNIFWIVVDSVRSYPGEGDWRYRLKIMDELDDFYNFTNAYTAAPSTIMSAASMFTGNNTFKIARNYNDWKLDNNEIVPIAKILKKKDFEILPIDNSKRAREMLQDIIGRLDYKYFCKGITHNSNWSNEIVLKQFSNVLKKSSSKKKFVMTWFDCRGDILTNNYVKGAIEEIKKNKLYENSLIIINSDHGYPDPQALKFKNIKKYRHDLVVTEDNIKVPLLVKIPGMKIKKDMKINTEVSLIDIYPTILDLIGIDKKENFKNDGESLINLINFNSTQTKDVENYNDRFLRSDTRLLLQDGKISCLIKNRKKYVYYHDTGFEEFYDLKEDPNELEDQSKNENFKKEFTSFKNYLRNQNLQYEKLQEKNLKINLKKSFDKIENKKKILLFCNLNNNYLNFIKNTLNEIFSKNITVDIYSTKENDQNNLSRNIKNFDILEATSINYDLLIVIDEKNYYRILDLTFLKIANKLKINKIFLDLNFNKNNLFFSKWVFPLLKYKNNFYFYKNEPFLLISDFIKITKLSYKQYIKGESVETPRMEDLKLHRDRVFKSKENINSKIEFYDFVFYLRNIGIWGGTQTQFWKLIETLQNYRILILYNSYSDKKIFENQFNNKNNKTDFKLVGKKNKENKFLIFKIYEKVLNFIARKTPDGKVKSLIKHIYDRYLKLYEKVRNAILRPIIKIRPINMLWRVVNSYTFLKSYFKRSKIVSVFLTENNIVNIMVFRLIGGKTGKIIVNERNNIQEQTSLIVRLIYRLILNENVLIVTNSLSTLNYFKKFHKNTKFVYNFFIENSKISSIKNHENLKQTSNQNLKMVNIGRFVRQKNQLDLIFKFSRLESKNKIYLDIIGRGELEVELYNATKKYNLQNIKIINSLTKSINYQLDDYDVLIINSLYEGQTNLLLEVLHSKTITIVNDALKKELLEMFKNTNFKELVYFYNSNNFEQIISMIKENKKQLVEKNLSEKNKFINDYKKFNNLSNVHIELINS